MTGDVVFDAPNRKVLQNQESESVCRSTTSSGSGSCSTQPSSGGFVLSRSETVSMKSTHDLIPVRSPPLRGDNDKSREGQRDHGPGKLSPGFV